MPLEINRSPKAERDAFSIWDYIAPHNPTAAEKMLRRIDKAIQMLAERPGNGRSYEEFGTGVRIFPVDNYMVFYRHSDTILTVIRILHAARDMTPDLFTD
ncbi:type II toxin-antitoxin system RelE/ParE family toxin [uncultured Devosia sp.]|uniref:type II toxin-antitoxin system RelE/ParE family toxin n=1 Tax=uncultured Devosia sp. TaxID=211434 RepID=UPI0035CC100F